MIIKVLIIVFLAIVNVIAKIEIYVTDKPVVQFGGRMYKKELLTDKYDGPKELSFDHFTRNLFFMYMDEEIQNSGRAVINVVTKKVKKIKGIIYNKATAVDPDTGEVYFGSENGLYKYDYLSNTASNIGLYNVNILKLVIRHNEMYLIDANNHMLYKVYDEGAMTRKFGIWRTVMTFDVDNNGNVHFVTMCGVFCANNKKEAVKNKDISLAYHFIVDGVKTLALTEDGIYEIHCANGTATKTASIDFIPKSIVLGVNGEIFYSLDDSIFRLKPIRSYFFYHIPKKN